jgi:hypothetical protein
MCTGSSPSRPKIKEVGPSKKEMRKQKKEIRGLKAEIRDTQKDFRQQLQAQIDAANLAAEEAAAEAAAQMAAMELANSQPVYTVETAQQEAVSPQVTQPVQPQQPIRTTGSLTIGARRAPATGLNIGR